jgi:hypothetical protein
MLQKKFLSVFIFLLIVSSFVFSSPRAASADSILCPPGTPDAGKICGITGLSTNEYITFTCSLLGSDTYNGNRILGGQKCSIGGTDDGGYYMSGTGTPNNDTPTFAFGSGQAPGWTYSKSATWRGSSISSIPSDQWVTSDNAYVLRFFGGNVIVSVSGDDEASIQIGSNAANVYGTTGCNSTGFRDVQKAGCPATSTFGSYSLSAQPGDVVIFNVQNDLRPNNGSGTWGAGTGTILLNDLTACYTAAYKKQIGGYSDTSANYNVTAKGVCSPSVSSSAPVLEATWPDGSKTKTVTLTQGQTSISAQPFNIKNKGGGSLSLDYCTISSFSSAPVCDGVVVSGGSTSSSVSASGISATLSNQINSTVRVFGYNTNNTSQTFTDSLSLIINPAPVTPPSGSISIPTTCQIATGASTCNVGVTWSVANPTANVSTQVKHDNPTDTLAFSYTPGVNVMTPVTIGSTTFYLYHNNLELANVSTVVTCAVPTDSWQLVSGTYKCAPGGVAKPDLSAGAVSPSGATVNTPITLSAPVLNLGNVSSGTSFPVLLQVSSSSLMLNAANQNIGSVGPAGKGEFLSVSTSYTFGAVGTYYARICADLSTSFVGVIDESNEGNNCGSPTTITVSSAPVSACGSDNNQTLSSVPMNTCAANNSLVGSVSGSGPWSWSCQNGSAAAVSCSATKSATPSGQGCGSPTLGQYGAPTGGNYCQSGYTYNGGYSLDVNRGVYTWSCGNGTTTGQSSCSTPYTGPVNGQCGPAVGNYSENPPIDYFPGYMCHTGTTGAVTAGQNGSWNYSCSGSNNGTVTQCSTAGVSLDTCYIWNAKAAKSELFYGQETSISWEGDPTCEVRVTGAARKVIAYDEEGNPVYGSTYYMNPGTASLKAYYRNDYGWTVPSASTPASITVTGYGYGVKVTNLSTNGGFFYQGETAKFKVEMPFGSAFYNYWDTDTYSFVPASFPVSLSSSLFALIGYPNPQDGDGFLYYDQSGNLERWYSMYPRDAANRYESPRGSFSPATLSSSGNWVSTWSIPIPSDALPGNYRYNIQTNPTGGNAAVAQMILPVLQNTTQPVVALSSNKYNITLGQSVTLSWTSKNVTACSANNFVTGGALSGSTSISPTSTTTYSIICDSASGQVTSSATITVTNANGVAPVVTFTARPNFITPGKQATLTWNAIGADSCVGDGNFSTGANSVTSGTAVVSPLATTTYTLTCTNNGTNASSIAKVTVTKFDYKER